METTVANVGKMETQLKQWFEKLDELAVKADKAGAAAKSDIRQRIDALKAKCQTAQSQLVKAASNENWETFKAGVESAWSELETAFRKIAN